MLRSYFLYAIILPEIIEAFIISIVLIALCQATFVVNEVTALLQIQVIGNLVLLHNTSSKQVSISQRSTDSMRIKQKKKINYKGLIYKNVVTVLYGFIAIYT